MKWFALLALLLAGCHEQPADWDALKRDLREKFPDVRQTNEVAGATVILDARSKAEFDVSHLPGARPFGPDIPKDAAIVVYCSVGYRSSQLARQLTHAGYTNVANLDGGIFQWANDGRPLEGGRKVHPYNAHWSRYLNPELR